MTDEEKRVLAVFRKSMKTRVQRHADEVAEDLVTQVVRKVVGKCSKELREEVSNLFVAELRKQLPRMVADTVREFRIWI